MKSTLFKALWVLPIGAFSCSVLADQAQYSVANGIVTGNVGVVSQYIYRGGVENDELAAQGGVEYAHKSGIAVGYWGSTLDYNPVNETKNHGFEHDFYLSYGQEIAKNLSYKLKATAYVYQNANNVYAEQNQHRKATAYDVLGELAYQDLSLGVAVMLADASSANAGDVYISAAYSHPLIHDFILNTSVGASIYNSSHDDLIVQTKKDFVFSEAKIGLSKAITDTGLLATLDYVVGGKDRLGDDFDNHVVVGLNYNF